MTTRRARRVSRSTGLTVRMVMVAVLTPVVAVGALALLIALLPHQRPWVLFFVGISMLVVLLDLVCRAMTPGAVVNEVEDPELCAIVDRLCVVADMPRPEIVIADQPQPNSWVVHQPGRTPRLVLTTALRDLLTTEELTAVLGHELSHIANRDALVMTVVGTPGSIMMRAGSAGAGFVALIGMFAHGAAALLSRYRELAADAGSAALTGRPSALASALLKVSGSLVQVPSQDLREAAKLNAFNLVAVAPERRRYSPVRIFPWLARLSATHPPLQTRLDALYALERDQQSSRA